MAIFYSYLEGLSVSLIQVALAGGLASTSQRSAAAPPAISEIPNPGQRDITNDGGSVYGKYSIKQFYYIYCFTLFPSYNGLG